MKNVKERKFKQMVNFDKLRCKKVLRNNMNQRAQPKQNKVNVQS